MKKKSKFMESDFAGKAIIIRENVDGAGTGGFEEEEYNQLQIESNNNNTGAVVDKPSPKVWCLVNDS